MCHNTSTKVYKKHTKQTKMIIKSTTVRKWIQYMDQGDQGKMANGNEVLRRKISRAFNKRSADLDTIKIINAFIENKRKAMEEIENNGTK